MKATATAQGQGPLTLTLELACEAAQPGTSPPPTTTPPPTTVTTLPPPPLGSFTKNADLTGVPIRPAGSFWYQRVDARPVHPRTRDIILAFAPVASSLPRRTQNDWGTDFGIPYSAGRGFAPVPLTILYAAESEGGPHPIPLDAPLETGPDKHLIYFDLLSRKLYELGMASREGDGFRCEACAVFDANRPDDQRPNGWTSADAAGLPILPGLVRFDEFDKAMSQSDVTKQHLGHALRFTLPRTGKGFLQPARHYTTNHGPYQLPTHPPMGMRCRVNPALDLSIFNSPTQVLLRTLQLYGGILADNGQPWFFTGTQDERWSKYWDAITGNVDGKLGFKSFAGPELFEKHWQILDFADSEVTTQV